LGISIVRIRIFSNNEIDFGDDIIKKGETMRLKVAQYKLKRSALAASVLLVLIYLLGVYGALFIEIPEGEGWSFVMSSVVLLGHAVLGTLLIFHSGSILVMARKAKSATWTWVSVLGLAGVLLSVGTGSSYITTDNDWFTFAMSVGFAISILAYLYGIYADQN
jgi:hypothetical protein